MSSKLFLTQDEVHAAVRQLCHQEDITGEARVWGVPRGGIPVALAIAAQVGAAVAPGPDVATHIIDDIFDSGRTAERYQQEYPGAIFLPLFDKRLHPWHGKWLIMPWEVSDESDDSATDLVVRLLQYIGEDPAREGLRQTPSRVLSAWQEWCAGYQMSVEDILTTFEDGADKCNELVVMRNIPVYSTCEHHLAPFFGKATIGYIPQGRIVGISKLVRLTNIFAKRLQVQERLTNQIADALVEHLSPTGVGVILECRHLCMESRGVCTPDTPTTTSALRGALFDDPRARAEFLQLRLKP